MPKPFSPDKYFAAALKYDTRAEFARSDQSSYQMLWRYKLLDKACAHMQISPVYSDVRWTPCAVFKEAAKYKSRAEFKRKCSGAYCFALANNLLDQACAYMPDSKRWHIFELMAVALKYERRFEFIRSEKSAYNYCNKNGLIDVICAHMQSTRISWDKQSVMEEAAKHQSRGALRILASGAYKHADQYGYLDEACAHMPPPSYGFAKDKAASLYYLRILIPGLPALYKIGITNRAPESRVTGMGLPDGGAAEVLQVIAFDSGAEARRVEKILHRRHRQYRYNGAPVMKNGNTELFTKDVMSAS